MLKQHCPHISVETAVVDFEQAEHQAIKEGFPNARIQGCLFDWKQCLVRHFDEIPTYRKDVSVRENHLRISGTVLVPRRKKKYNELDEKIFNAVGYDGRVDTEMYCRTLGHLNHKRQ